MSILRFVGIGLMLLGPLVSLFLFLRIPRQPLLQVALPQQLTHHSRNAPLPICRLYLPFPACAERRVLTSLALGMGMSAATSALGITRN